MKEVWSIGHSTKPLQEFIETLKFYKINVLVDVRKSPYSKFAPQFNRQILSKALIMNGIKYQWEGNNLGGFGVNLYWKEKIKEISDRCEKERIVIMCSEGDYKKCHRSQNIEPDLKKYEVKMKHILPTGNYVEEKQIHKTLF